MKLELQPWQKSILDQMLFGKGKLQLIKNVRSIRNEILVLKLLIESTPPPNLLPTTNNKER